VLQPFDLQITLVKVFLLLVVVERLEEMVLIGAKTVKEEPLVDVVSRVVSVVSICD
jgi:hypothetical protein